MNKQQLASKIWESANKMRSKIEANEYKDYFIFYKFLSDKEIAYLKSQGITDAELKELSEDDKDVVKEIARKKPLRAVFRDSSFSNSASKINVFEIFKMISPETSVKVI